MLMSLDGHERNEDTQQGVGKIVAEAPAIRSTTDIQTKATDRTATGKDHGGDLHSGWQGKRSEAT